MVVTRVLKRSWRYSDVSSVEQSLSLKFTELTSRKWVFANPDLAKDKESKVMRLELENARRNKIKLV
jgi:hypothetical protein